MKKFKLLLLALMCVAFLPSKADEGMWLLQLMQEQHLADRMKAQGLLLEADDIYNPNRVSLKDAVGIFGGGCTGIGREPSAHDTEGRGAEYTDSDSGKAFD